MDFKEDFLHFVWQYGLFDISKLETTDGKALSIIKKGIHNTDSGPDFFNARLLIDQTEWAGNIEIHKKSSDWFKHAHQNDEAYKSVILHVVYEHDADIDGHTGKIPTLELKNLIKSETIARYNNIINSKESIPCAKLFPDVNPQKVNFWLERLVVERLESKVKAIEELQQRYKNDWEQSFFNRLLRAYGFNINSLPFEQLAHSLDVRLLMKYAHNIKQTEALFFGTAGLLESPTDGEYYNTLKKEFEHLKVAHKIKPLNPLAWKFSKTRPWNFPTLRIAQIAALYHKHQKLFAKILSIESVEQIYSILDVEVSEFWKSHYTFQKKSPKKISSPGKSSIDSIIINAIVPTIFAYSLSTGNEDRKDKAIDFLYKLKPENNQITRQYEELGIKNDNSAMSQAILQLNKKYCKQKNCLICSIGKELLN